jgi:hypothetical protein
MNRKALAHALVALALCLPAACGGGGQEATPPTTPAASAPSAAPTDTGAESAAAASAAPSAAPAPTDTGAAAAAAPAGPPGPGDWDKWSHDQKLAYMKSTVMGKEKDLFSTYDSAKFGGLNCKSCHGSGASDGSFKMPSADLPKLDATPDGFKKLAKKNPKMFDFMMKQVEPQTASLLGEQPYDLKTNVGFGCFNCHTKK